MVGGVCTCGMVWQIGENDNVLLLEQQHQQALQIRIAQALYVQKYRKTR